MKKIAILGITGSIGISAIDVIRTHKEDFKIVLASSHSKFDELFVLAKEFIIPEIVITDSKLKNAITDIPDSTKLAFGEAALQNLIHSLDIDIVLNAISGSAGLVSSIATISAGKDLALANKESLVMAGHIVAEQLKNSNSKILPVDSEHSAIFQCIGLTPFREVRSLIITASGGPFRELPLSEFKNITLKDTLKHPTWEMGQKITIDSATMMNKGLEVIEAHWLFEKDYADIKAVIHPQSIIHSFVEYLDGSLIAQMSFPTMKLPILFALSYPNHFASDIINTKITDLPNLSFAELEKERYPLYYLAREVGKQNGLLPTIMNSANEAAIDLFLQEKINFTDIHKLISYYVESENNISKPDIDTIINSNKEVYKKAISDYKTILN
jgi:1-deoxy-D-xylulose-5-phosphate reductoisomerase